MLSYRILADGVVLLHFLFILFVIAGGLLVLHRAYLAVLHLPAAFWGAYVEFSGAICPLTPLENHLRRLAGYDGYSSGFIEHYLIPVIYPAFLTQQLQIYLGLFVVAVNLLVYILVLRRHHRRLRERTSVSCNR